MGVVKMSTKGEIDPFSRIMEGRIRKFPLVVRMRLLKGDRFYVVPSRKDQEWFPHVPSSLYLCISKLSGFLVFHEFL